MKKVIQTSLALWTMMGLVSACSKKSDEVQSEAIVQALSKSVFNPGENVSQTSALALMSEPLPAGTDGGYIAPPTDQTAGSTATTGESGNIPAPGGTSTGGQTDAGTVSSGTSSASNTGTTSNDSGSAASNTGTTSNDSGSVASNTGTTSNDSGSVASNNTGTTSNDSGSVASNTGTTSNDTGVIPSGSTPSGSGSSDVGVTPPPIDPGSVAVDDSGHVVNPATGGTASGGTSGNPESSEIVHTDSGAVTQNGSSSGSCTCKSSTPNNQLKFQLRRACSIKRSNSKSLFFEEAKNPIFTIEAVNNSGFLASPGFYHGSKAFSLVSVPLKGVDLMKGKYSNLASIALASFKKSKGLFWASTYLNINVCEDSNKNGFCYDEPAVNQLAVDVPDLKAGSIPRSLQINVFSGRHLTKYNQPWLCEAQYSPLVMDLSGNGFDFVGPESGVSFDIDDSGSPIPTGWIYSKDDALLVRDINGNRKIESGAELFGNATKLPSGQRAINGFEALRELDSDGNGLITSKDKAWTELKLWIDLNHDGVSQQRELMGLDRAGVESINLGYATVMEVDQFGNQTRERSTFIRRVRSKRYVMTVSDVWFNSFVAD